MVDYIYITGDARSGSTFADRLLSNHPDIEGMGEVQKLSLQFDRDGIWSEHAGLCSCGVRLKDCSIWGGIVSDVLEGYGADMSARPYSFRVSDIGRELDLGAKARRHWLFHYGYRAKRYSELRLLAALRRPMNCSRSPKFGERRLFVAERFASRIGARAVVDNSKDCASMIDLYRATNGKMKILWLTRDVRSIAASKAKLWSKDLVESASLWQKVNERIQRALSCFGKECWLHVRYEDLCLDTPGTCSRICDFLKFDRAEEMWTFKEGIHHSVGGDSMRLRKVEKVVPAVDKWRKQISPEQEASIWKRAGSFAETLGYTR